MRISDGTTWAARQSLFEEMLKLREEVKNAKGNRTKFVPPDIWEKTKKVLDLVARPKVKVNNEQLLAGWREGMKLRNELMNDPLVLAVKNGDRIFIPLHPRWFVAVYFVEDKDGNRTTTEDPHPFQIEAPDKSKVTRGFEGEQGTPFYIRATTIEEAYLVAASVHDQLGTESWETDGGVEYAYLAGTESDPNRQASV